MLRKSAGWKFSIIFSFIFWVSAVLLYAVAVIYIQISLRQESRMGIQVRLLGYWAIARSEGLEALADTIDVNEILSGEQTFFVRIADEFNNTKTIALPEHWSSFDFSILEKTRPKPGGYIVLRSPTLNYELETGCIVIGDDYFLQVGVGDENRRKIMKLLSESFSAALFFLLVISFCSGLITAYNFLKPVRALEKTVGEVLQTGSFKKRISDPKRAGELYQLVSSFNQMLQKIDDLIQGMTGALDTVAHDLRTPLTRFRMIAERVLSNDSATTEEYNKALEQGVVESETLLTMMDMLMDISEAETGILKLNVSDFSPLDCLNKIVDLYEFTAEDYGITIEIDENAYSGKLSADIYRFRQAAANLIDNALKYGKRGGFVKISLNATEDVVSLCVRDNGCGISSLDLPDIWKRLYRGKSSRDGLGLGLSLVSAIVKAHGGTTKVESILGEGSVFVIEFPKKNAKFTETLQ